MSEDESREGMREGVNEEGCECKEKRKKRSLIKEQKREGRKRKRRKGIKRK